MQKINDILRIIAILISIVCAQSAFGMENENDDVHIINPQAVVIEVLLRNRKDLSHTTVYALAAVNKACKKIVLDTAPGRTEYLRWLVGLGHSLRQYFRSWHNKFGTILGEKESQDIFLNLRKFCLVDEEEGIKGAWIFGMWDNFQPAMSLPQLFLNPQGDLCCYAFQNNDGPESPRRDLIQCCLTSDGKKKSFRCYLSLGEENNYQLSHCAGFPHLLKALVDCPEKEERGTKLFALKDAIIPDNYASTQLSHYIFVKPFNKLPEPLQEAIVTRYGECKKSKPILSIE